MNIGKCLVLSLFLLFFYCAAQNPARKSYQQKDYTKAVILCRQAIKQNPEKIENYLILIRSYRQLDSLNQAFEVSEAALKTDSSSPKLKDEIARLWIAKGDLAFEQHFYETAGRCYAKADSLTPGTVEIIAKLADADFETGHWENARAGYERCVNRVKDPSPFITRLNQLEGKIKISSEEYEKGVQAKKSGNTSEAIEHFQKAVAAYPNHKEAAYQMHLLTGITVSKKGTKKALNQAIDAFEKAAKTDLSKAEPLYRLAKIHEILKTDHYGAAIQAYRKVIALEPDSDIAKEAKHKVAKLKPRKAKLDKFWGKNN